MKNLIIIGARGFGREIHNLAKECSGYLIDYQIKGFLDIKKDVLSQFNSYPPVIDSYENYQVKEDDVFICAFGDVHSRKKCAQTIMGKGGEFISLIHPTASIATDAKIGNGCIVLHSAVIGSGSVIGNFVLIQSLAVIGHDVRIGNYSRIDCHAVCVGDVILEEKVTIHTSAVINHNVVVENGASVGALSFVIRKVKENTTVYGNPAIKLK